MGLKLNLNKLPLFRKSLKKKTIPDIIKMYFCKFCNKEVVIYGISYTSGIEDELALLRKKIEGEGKLLIFNPPSIGPYNCPKCFRVLEDI